MSFNDFFSNFIRSVSNTITLFESEDKLISEETKALLDNDKAKQSLSEQLFSKNKAEEGNRTIVVRYNDEDVELFVEH